MIISSVDRFLRFLDSTPSKENFFLKNILVAARKKGVSRCRSLRIAAS